MLEFKGFTNDYYGKVIYVDKLIYRHYGVGIGNGRVIHFVDNNCNPSDAKVIESSLSEFSEGSTIQICYRHYPKFSPDEIVSRALSETYGSFGGYDLFNNNCEHFAIWCATGLKTSNQVFFKEDDQDIISKAIDRIAEPGRAACAVIDDFIDDTVKFFKWIFD